MKYRKIIASTIIAILLISIVLTTNTHALSSEGVINSITKEITSKIEVTESKVVGDSTNPTPEHPIYLTCERSSVGEWKDHVELTFIYKGLNAIKSLVITKDGTQIASSTPAANTYQGTYAITVTQNGEYICVVEDVEGNKMTYRVTVSNIGQAEPSGTPTIELTYEPDSTVWTKEEKLIIKVSDSNGIKSVTIGIDGSSDVTTLSTSENEGTEKTYTYMINKNDTKYAVVAENLKCGKRTSRITFHNIDPTPPTNTAPTVVKGSSNTKIKVTCNQKDNESGIAKKGLKITKEGGTTTTVETIPTEYELPSTGKFTIQTVATDRAGNETVSEGTVYETSADPTPSGDPSPSPSSDPSPSPSGNPTPGEIQSDKYNVDYNESIITRVSPKTTKEEFVNNITIQGAYTILDENDKGVLEGYIKTGYKVKTSNNTYTIAVIGDLAPNGEIDVADLAKMRSHLVGFEGKVLTGAYLRAADVSGDGNVNIIDLSRMRSIIVGNMSV